MRRFVLASTLLCSILASPLFPPAVGAQPEEKRIQQDMERQKKDLAEIDRKLKEKKQESRLMKQLEKNVLSRLERMDRELERLNRESRVNSQDLRKTSGRITDLTVRTAETTEGLERMRGDLRRRLRALYRAGGKDSLWSFWLGTKSPGEVSRDLKFSMQLAQSNEKLIRRTVEEKERLTRDKRSLTFQRSRHERILNALGKQKQDALRSRTERARLLVSLRKEQALRQQTIKDLDSARRSLQSKLNTLMKRAEEARLAAKAVSAGGGLTALKGKLPWPVAGRILSPFGKFKSREFNTTFENTGIQIEAPTGTPIRAIAPGLVRYADWFKGFGKLVILDHGAGYYSLYAQASELYVAEGDKAAMGQVIASVGDTGSLVGEALYFELRRNGLPVNPVLWLRK